MRLFKFKQKRLLNWLVGLAGLLTLTIHGFWLNEVHNDFGYNKLAIQTPNKSTVTLALITDLHGCYYGENQMTLITKLQRNHPDVILLGGDIYDDKMPFTHTDTLLKQLSLIAPTYYVDGNHEWWLPQNQRLDTLNRIKSYGIHVIMGRQATIPNTNINLYGVSDPESGQFDTELTAVGAMAKPNNINILLSHRPERIEAYLKYPFDLVLSGHAHGGQWRVPFVLNGLIAPNQGLFPKYAGGIYTFKNQSNTTQLLVSRGLARESTKVPRFFNRPELVFITIHR